MDSPTGMRWRKLKTNPRDTLRFSENTCSVVDDSYLNIAVVDEASIFDQAFSDRHVAHHGTNKALFKLEFVAGNTIMIDEGEKVW